MNPSTSNSPHPIDTDLLSRLILGELEAFKKIYALYFKRVFHFTLRFSLTSEDAEEITQDVFVKLWQKRNLIDKEKNFSNFLYTIAQNLVIDKMRQYVSYEKKLRQLKNTSILNQFNVNCTEHLVNYYELAGIITKLIDKLPASRRTIFKLSREKGYTYPEIAELLHISQGTVEKQMSKSLKTLTSNLRSKYGILIELTILLPTCMLL